MNIEISRSKPEIMHIDLNSAFAMAEQQANPLLRGRPVGVSNRLSDTAICIAASPEAKDQGVGLGTRLPEARLKAPGFVMVESDPAKYQHVYQLVQQIFSSYTPGFVMRSVDEGILDFQGMNSLLNGRSLVDVGLEIKQRVREEVGDYMKINVGIAPNRWLAKLAAGFLKPDGLFVIDHQNLEAVYASLDLVDLPYIKQRNRLRLNGAGILTPLEFLRAPEPVLTKQVFKSINGRHWYLKLRGYETEVEWGIRSAGRSYVLDHRTADSEELKALLCRASMKVARRLGRNHLAARGVFLQLNYVGHPSRNVGYYRSGWQQRRMYPTAAWRGQQIFDRVLDLFAQSPQGRVVSSMALTTYALEPAPDRQLSLDDYWFGRTDSLERVMNSVNNKDGELVLAPATAWKSRNRMPDKIPFGSVRYFH